MASVYNAHNADMVVISRLLFGSMRIKVSDIARAFVC